MMRIVEAHSQHPVRTKCEPLRQLHGMTLESLAEKTEIGRRDVQRIERGMANPGVEVLARLRKAFRCAWDELLGG